MKTYCINNHLIPEHAVEFITELPIKNGEHSPEFIIHTKNENFRGTLSYEETIPNTNDNVVAVVVYHSDEESTSIEIPIVAWLVHSFFSDCSVPRVDPILMDTSGGFQQYGILNLKTGTVDVPYSDSYESLGDYIQESRKEFLKAEKKPPLSGEV